VDSPEFFEMPRHVILLTDAHEAPAYELIESLRLAGVTALIEGLREAGAGSPVGSVAYCSAL